MKGAPSCKRCIHGLSGDVVPKLNLEPELFAEKDRCGRGGHLRGRHAASEDEIGGT